MSTKVFEQSQKEGAEEFGFLWLGVQRTVLADLEAQGLDPAQNKGIVSAAILHTMRAMREAQDGYEAVAERHEQLACLTINATAFQNAAINWLAWRLGIPEETLHNLPENLPEIEGVQETKARLHRYELALDTVLEEFRHLPEYMGDENFGGKLARILMASRNFAQGNEMTAEEYRQEISEEDHGRN